MTYKYGIFSEILVLFLYKFSETFIQRNISFWTCEMRPLGHRIYSNTLSAGPKCVKRGAALVFAVAGYINIYNHLYNIIQKNIFTYHLYLFVLVYRPVSIPLLHLIKTEKSYYQNQVFRWYIKTFCHYLIHMKSIRLLRSSP